MKRQKFIISILLILTFIPLTLLTSCTDTNIKSDTNTTTRSITDTSTTISETTSNINEEFLQLETVTITESITTSTTTQTLQTDTNQITVYITDNGTKYHTEDCTYLKYTSTPITLQEAISKDYTPCSKCNPPELENTDIN